MDSAAAVRADWRSASLLLLNLVLSSSWSSIGSDNGVETMYNDSWGWTRAKKNRELITLAPPQAQIHMRRAARNGKTRAESFCELCFFCAVGL
jgi:hypothetical protein